MSSSPLRHFRSREPHLRTRVSPILRDMRQDTRRKTSRATKTRHATAGCSTTGVARNYTLQPSWSQPSSCLPRSRASFSNYFCLLIWHRRVAVLILEFATRLLVFREKTIAIAGVIGRGVFPSGRPGTILSRKEGYLTDTLSSAQRLTRTRYRFRRRATV